MIPVVRKTWIGWWVQGRWCPTRAIRDREVRKLNHPDALIPLRGRYPGEAVTVDDPCILNGCDAVVIQGHGRGRAYVVALVHSNGQAHLVREIVGVRDRPAA